MKISRILLGATGMNELTYSNLKRINILGDHFF